MKSKGERSGQAERPCLGRVTTGNEHQFTARIDFCFFLPRQRRSSMQSPSKSTTNVVNQEILPDRGQFTADFLQGSPIFIMDTSFILFPYVSVPRDAKHRVIMLTVTNTIILYVPRHDNYSNCYHRPSIRALKSP